MTPELQAKLENLVFSVPSPYLSLDNRLQPYLDLIAACERDTIERCALVAEDTTHQPMNYIDWSPGPAADDRARVIAAAIRALLS